MADQFVGRFIAFKGDDEYVPEEEILLEITEREHDQVEIAFNAPIPGKPRIYLALSLSELIRHALREGK